jgi:hypothetical protein
MSRSTRQHSDFLVSNLQKASSAISKTKCMAHPDLLLTQFCKKHDIAICDRCASLHHKPCDLLDLGDKSVLSAQQQQIEVMIKSSTEQATTCGALARTLIECCAADHSIIDCVFDQQIRLLNEQRQQLHDKEEKIMKPAIANAQVSHDKIMFTITDLHQLLRSQQLLHVLAKKTAYNEALCVDMRDVTATTAAALHQTHAQAGAIDFRMSTQELMSSFNDRRRQAQKEHKLSALGELVPKGINELRRLLSAFTMRIDLTEMSAQQRYSNAKKTLIRTLIEVSKSCPQLQVLNVGGCDQLTDAAIVAVAKGCPQLQQLNVGRCNLLHVDTLRASFPQIRVDFEPIQ